MGQSKEALPTRWSPRTPHDQHNIYPQGYGTHFHGSGTHTPKSGSRTLLAMWVPGLAGGFLDGSLLNSK